MSATNGASAKESNMVAMEMESLHPGSTTVRTNSKPPASFLSNLWMLIRLHIESHPQIFSIVGLLGLAFFMYVAVEYSRPPLERHKVTGDYSVLKMNYDFKAAQIDHWCLFVRLLAQEKEIQTANQNFAHFSLALCLRFSITLSWYFLGIIL